MTKFSAQYLEKIDDSSSPTPSFHECVQVGSEEAGWIEGACNGTLDSFQEYSCAYVAGWLEKKCALTFEDDDMEVSTDLGAFIDEVSRGGLKVPHTSTYCIVKAGLFYITKAKSRACCRKKLVHILELLNIFCEFGSFTKQFMGCLASVLLKGYSNFEKDHFQSGSRLYQSAVKKARLST